MYRRDFLKTGLVTGIMSSTPKVNTVGTVEREDYWENIRNLFPMPPKGIINLLNTGGGTVPLETLRLLSHYQRLSSSGGDYYYPELTSLKESGSSELLREKMAVTFGCEANEIAFTRNAMEGLGTGLLGVELYRGDEILTTTADYDSCIQIIKQREQRDGIKLKLVDIPMPATDEEILLSFEQAITPRTKVLLVCHMFNKNGQILPVRKISNLARSKNILSIVDGAQSIGHIDFKISDLQCDVFAASLHKWFYAPRGTGLLYIREEVIENIWPIWASWSGKSRSSIEKFEDFGTVSKAISASMQSVFDLHFKIGATRKEKRLRQLRDTWIEPLLDSGRVRLLTDLAEDKSCGITAFKVDGIDPDKLKLKMRADFNVDIGSIHLNDKPGFSGNYLAADLTNTEEEIEQFIFAFKRLLTRY